MILNLLSKLLEKISVQKLPLEKLRNNGLAENIQSARELKGDLLSFIEIGFENSDSELMPKIAAKNYQRESTVIVPTKDGAKSRGLCNKVRA